MLLGAEIGLLVYGIYVLIRGQYSMGRGRKIIGSKARILGAVCVAPLLLTFTISFVAGVTLGILNPDAVQAGAYQGLFVGIDLAVFVSIIVALLLLSSRYYKQQEGMIQRAL